MTIIIVETIDGVFGVINEVMNRPTTISGPRIFLLAELLDEHIVYGRAHEFRDTRDYSHRYEQAVFIGDADHEILVGDAVESAAHHKAQAYKKILPERAVFENLYILADDELYVYRHLRHIL